jgi:hypothetical protein
VLEYSRFDPEVLFAVRPAVVPGFSLRLKRNDAWVASARGLLLRPLVHLHLAFREKPLDGQFDSARHRSLAVGEGRECSPDVPSALTTAGRVRPSSKTIFSLAKSS